MKKLVLMLMMAIVMIPIGLNAQQKKNTIVINRVIAELNGEAIQTDTVITKLIPQDATISVLIAKADLFEFYTEFTYRFKGRRAKLVHRNYILMPDGSRKYGKMHKEMQELKVSVPKVFKGKVSESILYDKKTMSAMFVSYNYSYTY